MAERTYVKSGFLSWDAFGDYFCCLFCFLANFLGGRGKTGFGVNGPRHQDDKKLLFLLKCHGQFDMKNRTATS